MSQYSHRSILAEIVLLQVR